MSQATSAAPGGLLDPLASLARAAGEAILEVYRTDFAVRDKADGSPVTEADARAEAIILAGLHELDRQTPIVSEEAAAARDTPPAGSFWLVDPLDGTKEFIARNGEFTVNIALIHDHQPVLGIVLAPALGRLYAGAAGAGAFVEDGGTRRPIACRRAPPRGLTVASSRSHGDPAALAAFLRGRAVARTLTAGSSLKFCLVAAGEADLYPRLGRTMEWDTAAGDAIVRAAGGSVVDLAGHVLTYGKPGFENPHFVARGTG